MRTVLIALFALSIISSCRSKQELTMVPDQQGGFIELTVDGKPIDDPQSPLCPKDVNSIKLSCFAIQEADTTIIGFRGMYRRLWIDMYAEGLNDIGDVDFYINSFYPSFKVLEANDPLKWQNQRTGITYWDWDLPVGDYGFDETQPHSFVINKYDEANRFIEGSFDVGYKTHGFEKPMRAYAPTVRLKGRFKAKVRLMKEGKFID